MLGVAIALMSLGAGCADRLIMPPVPAPTPGDGSHRVTFNHNNAAIESFRARSPGAENIEPRAFVLRFSGDANCAAKFTADRWQHRPIEAWVVNYPGYGGSTGPRTLKQLAQSALAAYDEIRRVAGDRPIILEGFSLGTVPALHVAANRAARGLILQNPPPLREHILAKHGWWNLWLLAAPIAWSVPRECDSIANAKRATAPAVFLMADHDTAIPPDHQQLIAVAYAGPKRVITQLGADHVTPLDEQTTQQLHDAMDWLVGVGSTNPAR